MFGRHYNIRVCFLVIVIGLTTAYGQDCEIKIESPQLHDSVNGRATITAKVTTPVQSSLWVLTRMKGRANWELQGTGPFKIRAGRLNAPVRYGGESDSGRPFQLLVIALGLKESSALQNWTKTQVAINESLLSTSLCQQQIEVVRYR